MSDEPSETTQADIELLLNSCVEYAQHSLGERGGLIPVAVGLGLEPDADGEEEVSVFEPDPEPDGEEQAQEALEGLEEHLRSNRHFFRAVALAFDVEDTDDTGSITILIAHSDGTTVDAQIPHWDVDDGWELGELVSYPGTLDIWD